MGPEAASNAAISVIFDSDVLIWFLRGEPAAAALFDATADRAISIITFMEIQQGAQSKREMKTTRDLLQQRGFRVLPLTESIGHVAAGLIEEHALSSGLRVEDALIAATALENHEVLSTGNVRHFRPISKLTTKAFRPNSG